MTYFESIILGLIQGITEFLPISSSGHLIIAREFLGLSLEGSLSFDVFIHLATLLAILIAFRGDISRLVHDLFTQGFSTRSNKLFWALVWGTIPAAVMGFFFQSEIESIFRHAHFVAYALIAGSIVFFIADRIPHEGEGGITKLKGLFVGVFQTFALIPGVSRSGITISGGLLFGLSREEAIRFTFLLGIPVFIGAGLKTFLDLGSNFAYNDPIIWVGFVAAFISGLATIKFLIKFLARHSFNVFIIYRLLLATLILWLL